MYKNAVKSHIDSDIKIVKKNITLSKLIANKENFKLLAIVNESNKLVGIIDYRQLSISVLKQLSKKTTKNIEAVLNKEISFYMNKDFITAYPEDDLEKIFDNMLKNKTEYIIIVDNKNHPLGVANLYDLYETVIKLKIRNIGLNISLIEEKSSMEKDNVIKNLIKEIDT